MDLEEVILIDSDDEASLFCSLVDEYPFPPKTPFFNSKKKEVIIVENFDVFNKRVVPVLFRKDSPTTPLTKKEVDILWKELLLGNYAIATTKVNEKNEYTSITERYHKSFMKKKKKLPDFIDKCFMKSVNDLTENKDYIRNAKRKQQLEYEKEILQRHNTFLKQPVLLVNTVITKKTKSDMKEQQLESRKRKFICTDNHTDIDTDIIMKEAKLQAKIQEYNDLFEEELKNLENIIKELKRSEATNSEFLSEQLNYKDKYYETLDLLSYKEDENEQLIKKIKQLETLIFK